MNRRELLAQPVDAIVVELLLVERVGGKPDLQHRNARRIVLDDDRRLDAGGQQHADEVRGGDDL